LASVHGALVDVYGVGVLLRGRSGIGKSECALELVTRGHRLVADDRVLLRPDDAGDGGVRGSAPETIRHYMEVRGLGLLSIPELFGPEAVRDETRVDLVCHLREWRLGEDYERVGLDWPTEEVGGASVPVVTLPARPASSMATIVETAARELGRRRTGVNAARRLDERLVRTLRGEET